MNNTIFHRRRVEHFAQLVEEAGRPRHRRTPPPAGSGIGARVGGSALDDELAGYAELGQRIRRLEHPADATPEEGFRTSLRAMLVATAQREGIGCTAGTAAVPPARRRARRARAYLVAGAAPVEEQPVPTGLRNRRTRGALIIGLAAGTLALSGMSAASSDARPGDVLYSVKRSTESARLALTTTDMMRGELYLDFAGNRANEAARAGDTAGLVALLNDMDDQTVQGIRLLTTWTAERRDPSVLDFVDAWATTQHARLSRLNTRGRLARVGHSLALLQQIQARSTALRGALACGAAASTADTLGPVPGPCPGQGTDGGSLSSHTSGTGTMGGGSHGTQGSVPGRVGSAAPAVPAPAGAPTGTPAPAGNPQTSPAQNVNPQVPQSTATKSHKADAAAGAGELLGGLL